jgi:hypothetical protein
MSAATLREEMRLVLPDGRVASGAEAWAVLLRSVWWLWPAGFALELPGLRHLGRLAYRCVARHRNCGSNECSQAKPCARRRRTIPFLDFP